MNQVDDLRTELTAVRNEAQANADLLAVLGGGNANANVQPFG